MRTNAKTTEMNLIEGLKIVALFAFIGLVMFAFKDCSADENVPIYTDSDQQQEMLDYQYSQGRYDIVID